MIKEDNIENNDKKKNLNAYMKFPLMRRRMTCVIKKENSENNDKEKELECLYDTSPGEKEDDVCDLKKITIMKIMTRKKNLDALMTLPLSRWMKV